MKYNIPTSEMPRERFIKYGVRNLQTSELISIILNTGTNNKSILELSNNILDLVNNIYDLKDLTLNELKTINGIGQVKAIKLLSAIELGRRVYNDKKFNNIKLNTANKVYEFIKDEFNDNQEYFFCLYLDTKNNFIDKKLLFIGTINKSIVHPREIFKYAYLLSASKIICVHNHPSGEIDPSKEDIILTKNLIEIGNLQGINIIDHIIIGNGYYSFKENGNI
ncbi:MAG: DNA repair protein RadC [Bacilli bacterium]|nr:DNA repair protein RadC [Bacilli bacterium]